MSAVLNSRQKASAKRVNEERRTEAADVFAAKLTKLSAGKVTLSEYINNKRVTVCCAEHGLWTSEARNVLRSPRGCRHCVKAV